MDEAIGNLVYPHPFGDILVYQLVRGHNLRVLELRYTGQILPDR